MPEKPFHKLSRQRRYQLRRCKEGKCKICGNLQVKSRTGRLSGYCEFHLEVNRRLSREYAKRKRDNINDKSQTTII